MAGGAPVTFLPVVNPLALTVATAVIVWCGVAALLRIRAAGRPARPGALAMGRDIRRGATAGAGLLASGSRRGHAGATGRGRCT